MTKQKGGGGDTSNALFAISERVLCFHGPLIYEAKVLKIALRDMEKEKQREREKEAKEKGEGKKEKEKEKEKPADKKEKSGEKEICYWVHYNGWSKKWDEWVPERRVLRYTEENIRKQQELEQIVQEKTKGKKTSLKVAVTKKKSTGGDSGSVNLSTTDSRSSTPILEVLKHPKSKPDNWKPSEDEISKKKKRSEFVEPENQFEIKPEINIQLPEKLKLFLVDDWDFITRQKRLVNIPARHTVDTILSDYLKYVKEQNEDEATARDLVTGIKEYFNVLLGSQLMYRYERQQFVDFDLESRKDEEKPVPPVSSVYGAAHLLRLFTRIGACLTYTSLDTEAVELLCKCLEKFVKFLELNYKEYFSVDDYGAAPPDYQRKGKRQFPVEAPPKPVVDIAPKTPTPA